MIQRVIYHYPSNLLTIKNKCFHASTWSIQQTRFILKRKMASCATYCIRILEQLEKRNQWPLVRVINVNTDANKDVGSVFLPITDRKSVSSQILRQPITKIMLLVQIDFNFPTKRAKQRFEDYSSCWRSQIK